MIFKSFFKLVKLFLGALLDIIYPPYCSYCGKFGAYLCSNCFALINFYTLPLEIKIIDPQLDKLIACAQYAEPIKSLIKKMKYNSAKDIGKILGKMLWESTAVPQVDLITSVPLYPSRKNKRGFNQAEIIATELARLAKIPYQETLIRTINNKNQASIKDKAKRLRNLENVFQISQKLSKKISSYSELSTFPYPNFAGSDPASPTPKKILIVDDVTTTGATLNECAATLKKFGAQEVIGLVIAHGN